MDNQLQSLTNGFFARHETFCPRYGWLKKGFDRINGYNGFEKESSIFDADDAIEKLGVGKNQDSPTDEDKEQKFEQLLKDALKSLIDADKNLIISIQDIISGAFKYKNSFTAFKKDITKRAEPLLKPCRDRKLKSVISSMLNKDLSPENWAAAIASAAMTRPVRAWRDNDLNEFPTIINDLAQIFNDFEAVVKSQQGFTESKDAQVRLISFTHPDGSHSKQIIRADENTILKAKTALKTIKKNYSRTELEALMLMLGDELLKQEKN